MIFEDINISPGWLVGNWVRQNLHWNFWNR